MVPLLDMEAPVAEKSRQQLVAKVSISILVMSLPVLYVSFLHVPPATLFRDTTFWFLMSNSIIVAIAADSGMLFFGGSSSSACDIVVDDCPFVDISGDAASMVVGDPDDELLPLVVIVNNSQTPLVAARDVVHGGDAVAMDNHARALIATGAHEDGVDQPESGKMIMTSGKPSTAAQVQGRLTASKSLVREERTSRRRRSRSHSNALVAAMPPVQDKSVIVVTKEIKLQRTATEGRQPQLATAEEDEESEYARLSDEELNRRVEDFITRFNREIRLQIEKEELVSGAGISRETIQNR